MIKTDGNNVVKISHIEFGSIAAFIDPDSCEIKTELGVGTVVQTLNDSVVIELSNERRVNNKKECTVVLYDSATKSDKEWNSALSDAHRGDIDPLVSIINKNNVTDKIKRLSHKKGDGSMSKDKTQDKHSFLGTILGQRYVPRVGEKMKGKSTGNEVVVQKVPSLKFFVDNEGNTHTTKKDHWVLPSDVEVIKIHARRSKSGVNFIKFDVVVEKEEENLLLQVCRSYRPKEREPYYVRRIKTDFFGQPYVVEDEVKARERAAALVVCGLLSVQGEWL